MLSADPLNATGIAIKPRYSHYLLVTFDAFATLVLHMGAADLDDMIPLVRLDRDRIAQGFHRWDQAPRGVDGRRNTWSIGRLPWTFAPRGGGSPGASRNRLGRIAPVLERVLVTPRRRELSGLIGIVARCIVARSVDTGRS